MSRVAVIDYGAGNLRSVTKALEHVAMQHDSVELVEDAAQLAQATHIILPGVGAFADCMRGLQSLPGMIAMLEKRVREEKIPFLGICVGMQMLLETGHEHGRHQGLGWLAGKVLPLQPQGLKVPHMGWNDLEITHPHPLLEKIHTGDHMYFVHSYHCAMQHEKDIIVTTDYGSAVTAAVARENIMGVQFHPEKSQQSGLQLFRNFLLMGHHAPSR